MSGRQTNIPARRISSGTTSEREAMTDNSYGHIRYNTDEYYLEIYHSDANNPTGWRDLITNNKDEIDLSGLLVGDDASFNVFLKVPDVSFDTIHALNGDVITLTEDVSINGGLTVSDICVNNIKALNDEQIIINSDVSFNEKLSGTEASFNVIGVDKIISDNVIEVMSDISFNGDISCNNIVFSGVIKNAAGEEVGLTLDVALMKDNANDTSFEKISWLRFDKDSHFDISDGGGTDSSYLDIKIIHQPEISYNVIQEHTPGSKITFTSDVSMNESLRVSDVSLNTVRALNGNTITFLNDVSINKLTVNDLSNLQFFDLSKNFHDLSATYYELSGAVTRNITNIGDISGHVSDLSVNFIDLSKNFHDLSGTYYELSGAVTTNITSIGDISAHVSDLSVNFIDLSKNFHDLSGTYYELSGAVTRNITNIGDISAHVSDLSVNFIDISKNFHDLSGTYYELSGAVTTNITSIGDISAHVSDLSINFIDLSKNFHDLSDTYYELSGAVTRNITSIGDISGHVSDLSINFIDLSKNFHDLSDTYYTLSGDFDTFKQNVKTNDLSANNISVNSGNNIKFLSDVSFNKDVTITGDLIIDGSFNFNDVIHNITTVNNELLISTQLDICNQGTGPAIEVTQIGNGINNDIALFKSSVTDKAFEILHDGKSIFYKDVSFNGKIIGDLSSEAFNDLSINFIDLSKNFHDLSGTYYTLSGDVTKNITNIGDISAHVSDLSINFIDLSKNFHDLSGTYYELSGAVTTNIISIGDISAHVSDLSINFIDLSKNFHDLSGTYYELSGAVTTNITNIGDISAHVSDLSVNFIDLSKNFHDLSGTYYTLSGDVTKNITNIGDISAHVSDLSINFIDLSKNFHDLSGTYYTLSGDVTKNITSIGDISGHVGDLSVNFIDLSKNFHDLSGTYYELSGAVTKNITSIGDISGHVSDLSVNFIDLSKNFHDLSGTYYTLSGDVTKNITSIGDISAHVSDLSVNFIDISKNFHDLSGTYYTLSGDLDLFKQNVKTNDLSANNISVNSGNNVRFLSDVSFNQDVTITGDLIIDGSFNFNDIIHNITTVNNELLISTQLDICNQGTGPALEVTQIGSADTDDVALFKSGVTDKAFEILHDGKSIFYKDVSFNGKIIGDLSSEAFNDLSINFIDLSKNFHDLSGTYYTLSGDVTRNITNIGDISGHVSDLSVNFIDLSKNFHDLSGTYYTLSGDVTRNITNIGDISGHVSDLSVNFIDLSKNFHDLSGTYYTLSGDVTRNIIRIGDISGHVSDLSVNFIDLSKNFHDLSGTYYTLSGDVTRNIIRIGDISGHVSDLSVNFIDLSKNFHDLSGTYYTLSGDLDLFKQNVKTNDLSVNNISLNTGNNINFLSDVSFNQDVTITGDLIIDGSFNFNEVIQNITTVNNELLISTQLDISNQGTGPALEVTQIGTGDTNDVALFKSGVTNNDKAFEIKSDGKSIFYKDVSFHNNIYGNDASFQNNVDIENNLVVMGDISVNSKLSGTDASFTSLSVGKLMGYSPIEVMHDMSLNTRLVVPDASVNRIQPIDGSLIIIGDLSVNGNIFSNDGELGVDGKWILGANSTNHYTFQGTGLNGTTVNDPTLYLVRGNRYKFLNQNSSGAHPFYIKNEHLNSTDGQYGTGVTNNGGKGGTIITFEVPQDAPSELYYQCSSHTSMKGTLKIVGGNIGADASFNVIQEYTPGSKITFVSDVSINEDLRVDSAHLNNITALSNRIIVNSDISVNGNIYSLNISDISKVVTQNITDISDVSGLVFDISKVVTQNITDISDVSGLVFDISKVVTQNIADISDVSGLVFDLSKTVTQNIADISDVSGLVFDISKVVTQNIADISDVSGLVFDLSKTVTQNIADISDVSGLVFDLSSNFYTLSGDYDLFKQNVKTDDISVNNISVSSGNRVTFLSDVSFLEDVNIIGNLVITGSLTETTTNTQAIQSTRLEISNNSDVLAAVIINKTGGTGSVALFKNADGSAVEIDGTGKSIFYKDVSFNEKISVQDASFMNDVTIKGNLYIDGSFNFNDVIHNITTVNNELLISTQLDICNQGTGPALEVTQIGSADTDDVALFKSGVSDSDKAFEIKHDGEAIFYKDVSFHTKIIVPDASFSRIAPIDGSLVIMGDLSVNGQIFSSGGIVGGGGGSGKDASFNIIQEFMDGSAITFLSDVSINTKLIVPDASFNRIAPIDGSLVIMGDLSVNGQIFISGGIVGVGGGGGGGGGGSGNDASFNVIQEFSDGSGITFLSDVSINTQLTVPDASFSRIGPIDGTSLVITSDISISGNILADNIKFIPTGALQSYKLFDNSLAQSTPTDTSWNVISSKTFKKDSVVIHNIKVSSYIESGYIDWPESGHEYILKRKEGNASPYTWDSTKSYESFNYIFDSQNNHEIASYTLTEKITSEQTYDRWCVDISGDGARNDSTDKLTWDVTVISPEVLTTSSHINNITLFDASAADDISTNTIWEIPNQAVSIPAGSMIFHDIKVSGYITPGFVDWPLEGHEFIFQRKTSAAASYTWNSDFSYQHVKHIFNAQEVHEEQVYTMMETIPNEVNYTHWKCDISGDGARTDNSDKLTWKMIVITPSDYTTTPQRTEVINIFDNTSPNTSSGSAPHPWTSNKSTFFKSGTILFHNLKLSGFVQSGSGFVWPTGGHKWILRRQVGGSLTWDTPDTSYVLRHTFNRQVDHEEDYFAFTETLLNDVTYTNWQIDFSGGGALNDATDKINWSITAMSPKSLYISPIPEDSTIIYDISSNGLSTFRDISTERIHFKGRRGTGSTSSETTFSGHLIPTEHDTYDIGNAEFKIRDLYVEGGSSIWLGDENKMYVSSDSSNIRIRKMNKNGVKPSGYKTAPEGGTNWPDGDNILGNIEVAEWKQWGIKAWHKHVIEYEASFNAVGIYKGSDLFKDATDNDFENDLFIGDVSSSGVSKFTDASFQNNVDIGGKLVVNGDVSFNAHLSAVDASFQNNVDISGKLVVDDISGVNKITFSDGTTSATAAPSYFGIDFFPTTYNANLDGLQYLSSRSPVTGPPDPILFINLPFSYKIIGVSIALDTDGPHTGSGKNYHFQIQTRPAENSENTGTAIGDVLQLNNVKSRMSRSGLFTTNMVIGPSLDIALHLDSTASGDSPEIIMKLWCQTV